MLLPWLIGFGITVPLYFGVGAEFKWSPNNGLCNATVNGAYMVAWNAIGVYIPMAIMGTSYTTLFVRSRFSSGGGSVNPVAGVSEAINEQQKQRRLKRLQITNMLMTAFVWYCVCFVPSPVINNHWPWLYRQYTMLQLWVSKTLLLCGYSVSPVILIEIHSLHPNQRIHDLPDEVK